MDVPDPGPARGRGAAHAGRRGRAVRRRAAGRGGGDGAPAGHRPRAARGRAGRPAAAAATPSRPPRWRRRCAGTWTRCERGPARRSRSSSSATAPRSPGGSESLARAVAERLLDRLPGHRLHDLRRRLRDLAQRAAGRGLSDVNGVEVRRFPSVAGARPRRLQRLLGAAVPRAALARRRDRVAAAPGARGARARRRARRGGGPLPRRRVLHLPLLPDVLGPEGGARGAASSCPPPTTSRRCGSRSTTRCSPGRARSPSSPRRRRRWCARASTSAGARPRWRASGSTCRRRRTRAAFRARHSVAGPYALYAGRIDAGKGCAEMVAHYAALSRRRAAARTCVLIGALAMELPPVPGLRYLGFLSDEDKQAAMAGRARRGLLEPLREPLHRAAGGVRGRRARPGERALRRAQGPLPARERRPVLRRRATSSRRPSTCSSPTTRCAAAWARAAAATSTRTTGGTSCSTATARSSKPRRDKRALRRLPTRSCRATIGYVTSASTCRAWWTIEDTFLPVAQMRQISRVTELDGSVIRGEVDLGTEHWVYPQHFPGDPIFPGTLMIEAAGQLVALWAWANGERGRPRLVRVEAEFRGPVGRSEQRLALRAEVRAQAKPLLREGRRASGGRRDRERDRGAGGPGTRAVAGSRIHADFDPSLNTGGIRPGAD